MEHIVEAQSARSSTTLQWRDFVLILCAVLLTGLLLRTFVVGAVRITGRSMEHTLLSGDLVVVSKLTRFLSGSPVLGDVVAVSIHHGDPEATQRGFDVTVVKRCAAAPGDTIAIRGSRVWVNREELRFPPTAQWDTGSTTPLDSAPADIGPLIVPRAGMVLVLTRESFVQWKGVIQGEGHRVELDEENQIRIDGKVSTSYQTTRDYCFLLGDNQSMSVDSRAWGVVPTDDIMGKVVLVYWSLGTAKESPSLIEQFRSIRWDRIGGLVL